MKTFSALVLVSCATAATAFVIVQEQTRAFSKTPNHLAATAHKVAESNDNNSSQSVISTVRQRSLASFWTRKNWNALASAAVFSTAVFMSGLSPVRADTTAVSTTTGAASAAVATKYDGFAEYAKENKMQQSDVGCFIQQCGAETKNLFSNPRGIKGVSCLGRCKGEQSCATRCFAEFGSENLNDWLSCTIEEHECVKVPKNVDNSAEKLGYTTALRNFDPSSLIGKWYKTDGLNPNYDLFDCQTNTFEAAVDNNNELNMGIFFRVQRPQESGGGFWENSLVEHMIVDNKKGSAGPEGLVDRANAAENVKEEKNIDVSSTMHTSGKMYGLQFSENWYILGESDGSNGIPPYKLVAYKGHTLQGNYEGAFVYAKEPILPSAARPAVRDAAAKAGLDFNKFTRIDNTCPAGQALNDAEAGTGTSSTDWIDLVVGEGGVIDWISPGWRGEYNKKGV